MSKHTIESDGHTLEVKTSGLGPESVSYDGDKESSKFSIFGGDHKFEKEENGEVVKYDVSIRSGLIIPRITVRKNGKIIYTCR